MKKLTFIIIFVIIGPLVLGQNIENLLAKNRNIFVRIIEERDPRIMDKNEAELRSRLVNLSETNLFMRIDSVLATTLDTSGADQKIYILKVFISNRYFRDDFDSQFSEFEDFYSENDGYYYFGRYYEVTKRLEVFPNLIYNVCTKKSHIGRKIKCKSIQEHIGANVSFLNTLNPKFDYYFKLAIKTFVVSKNSLGEIELYKKYNKYSESDDMQTTNSYSFKKLFFPDNSLPPEILMKSSPSEDAVSNNNYEKYIAKTKDTTSHIGWVYVGRVDSKANKLINSNVVAVLPISTNQKIKSNKNINLRSEKPLYTNGEWKMGKKLAIVSENRDLLILEQIMIPGVDGYQLLWLKVEVLH